MTGTFKQQRREVLYTGHVQGVGFRYTVRAISCHFDVVGFVRNLVDGRVQLVAEGEEGVLDKFLAAVEQTMRNHIYDAQVNHLAPTGKFTGFQILP